MINLQKSAWVARNENDERVILFHETDASDERLYATHIEVRNGAGSVARFWGHYRMTLAEALEDFNERVAKGS